MFDAAKREAEHEAWLTREGLTERPIVAHITDTTTGETRAWSGVTGIFEGDEFRDFIWCEGNFACDCNRGQFFAEAGGVDVEDLDDDDDPFPCGDWRYVVRITDAAGSLLYEDSAEGAEAATTPS